MSGSPAIHGMNGVTQTTEMAPPEMRGATNALSHSPLECRGCKDRYELVVSVLGRNKHFCRAFTLFDDAACWTGSEGSIVTFISGAVRTLKRRVASPRVHGAVVKRSQLHLSYVPTSGALYLMPKQETQPDRSV